MTQIIDEKTAQAGLWFAQWLFFDNLTIIVALYPVASVKAVTLFHGAPSYDPQYHGAPLG